MRRRTAWITTISIIVATATGCGNQQSDPFIDVANGAPATIGSPDAPQAAEAPTEAILATTTAASTTQPPAPVTVPVPVATDARAELVAVDVAAEAFIETADAAVTCLSAPAECDPSSVAAPGGPAHERFALLVATFHDAGYLVRHLPDVTHATIESATMVDPDTVVATVCDVDGDVVVEPAASNGFGLDLIIDDLVVARRVEVELRRSASGWRRWAVRQLGEWPMEPTCGAH